MPLSRLAEKSARSGSRVRSFSVTVTTMDAELKFDDIELKTTGKELFELICRTIGLRETWYFGLQYTDCKGDVVWLRHDKKITDQGVPIAKDVPRSFLFLVKFYPEDIAQELIQEVTQHLFFLQIKQSILNMDLYCPPEATVLLASYAVQAKYGDYDASTYRPEMLSTEDLLPQRVIDQYQMTPDMWADKIKEWYMASRGMPRDEAEMEYMKIAQDLEMYAVNYFQIKNKRGSDLWLGVTTLGLNIYELDNRLHPKVTFPWNEIKNISCSDRRFTIKLLDKKSVDFVFLAQTSKINKLILELCEGSHALFMRRRRPESMEVQQMRVQGREERARRQLERAALVKEKQRREEAERERGELEQRLHGMQEQLRMSQEALERSEEAADLLAEKVRIADEECTLLTLKANEAEVEKQRIQVAAIKTEEEKLELEIRAREAELMASRIVEECELRAKEAQQLKAELSVARLAEKMARDRYQVFLHSAAYGDLGGMHYRPGDPDICDLHLVGGVSPLTTEEGAERQSCDLVRSCDLMPTADMNTLSREIEKERVEYLEKSRSLHDQLKELKSEIEVLKVEEKRSQLDCLHDQSTEHGENKYSTLGKIKGGTAKSRVQFYEEL